MNHSQFTQINILSKNAAKRTFKPNLVKIRVTGALGICGYFFREIRETCALGICGYFFCKTNPILRKSQMNVTSFNTAKYVKLDTWSDGKNKPNQTQFKPNSNPIQTQFIKCLK